MKNCRWIVPLLTFSFAALLVAGCVAPRRQPESAIFCSKCRMVWVETLDYDEPWGEFTTSEQVMSCPDCESAVAHFFKTGVFEHACSTCGDEFVHCTAH